MFCKKIDVYIGYTSILCLWEELKKRIKISVIPSMAFIFLNDSKEPTGCCRRKPVYKRRRY